MIEKPLLTIKDNETKEVLKHIFTEAEGRQKDLLSDTPNAKTVDEKAFKLYWTGTALRLYTKYSGSLYYLEFTAA